MSLSWKDLTTTEFLDHPFAPQCTTWVVLTVPKAKAEKRATLYWVLAQFLSLVFPLLKLCSLEQLLQGGSSRKRSRASCLKADR